MLQAVKRRSCVSAGPENNSYKAQAVTTWRARISSISSSVSAWGTLQDACSLSQMLRSQDQSSGMSSSLSLKGTCQQETSQHWLRSTLSPPSAL